MIGIPTKPPGISNGTLSFNVKFKREIMVMEIIERIEFLEKENKKLQGQIDFLSFRLDLIAYKGPVNELLYEYGVTEEQYKKIMDLMDALREKIDNGQKISHGEYETEINKIMLDPKYDYHFAESIARAFMEERRWEEIFPALYGSFSKYRAYFDDRRKDE